MVVVMTSDERKPARRPKRVDLLSLVMPWYRDVEFPVVMQIPGDGLVYVPLFDHTDDLRATMGTLGVAEEKYTIRQVYDADALLRALRMADMPNLRLITNLQIIDDEPHGRVIDFNDPLYQ